LYQISSIQKLESSFVGNWAKRECCVTLTFSPFYLVGALHIPTSLYQHGNKMR